MNKILSRITNKMYDMDLDFVDIKEKKYHVIRNELFISHYYNGNLICRVDLNKKEFRLFNCGYEKYRLTTAQLNWLEEFYKYKNYKLVYRGY